MLSYWIDFVTSINQLTNPAFWAIFSAIVTSTFSTLLGWLFYKKKIKIEKQREEAKELKEKQDKYDKELKDLYILYIDLYTQIITKAGLKENLLPEDIYPLRACMIKIYFITKNKEIRELSKCCYEFIASSINFSQNPSSMQEVKKNEYQVILKIREKTWELNKLIGAELAKNPA